MKRGKSKASTVASKGKTKFSIFPSFITSEKRTQEFQQMVRSDIDVPPDYTITLQESKRSSMRFIYDLSETKLDFHSSSDVYFSKKSALYLLDNSVHIYELLRLHARGEGRIHVMDVPPVRTKKIYSQHHVVVSGFNVGNHDILIRSYCCSRELKLTKSKSKNEPSTSNICIVSIATDLDDKFTHLVLETYIDLVDNVIGARYNPIKNGMEYLTVDVDDDSIASDAEWLMWKPESNQVLKHFRMPKHECTDWVD
jgi:hypothetical protein